jgi:uncharacterized membrane protein
MSARIPVHQIAAVLLLPATAGITYVVLRTLARRSVPADRQKPLLTIGVHVVLFVVVLHVLVVSNLAGLSWARDLGPRAVVVLVGAVFVSAGNLLPRTPRNLAIGIRTQRTLDDPLAWSKIHRVCGYAAVGLGCTIALAGMFLPGATIGAVVVLSAIAAAVSVTVAYSRVA